MLKFQTAVPVSFGIPSAPSPTPHLMMCRQTFGCRYKLFAVIIFFRNCDLVENVHICMGWDVQRYMAVVPCVDKTPSLPLFTVLTIVARKNSCLLSEIGAWFRFQTWMVNTSLLNVECETSSYYFLSITLGISFLHWNHRHSLKPQCQPRKFAITSSKRLWYDTAKDQTRDLRTRSERCTHLGI